MRQLRGCTDAIDAPFVRSSFVGNAGILGYTPGVTVAVKAETHNHPSAIEPFGGSNTGVGGVIRDVMGAAHHPIAITDILCFGPTDFPAHQLPEGVLHPRLIESGVVAGVADYGNKIGLPTVAGAVLYDPGYLANPLVYAGCIGVAHEGAWQLPGPQPGDLVVVMGGRTGRDGLRGATFSSATMDATTGDVAGASVQIGDPITEKLLIDVMRECIGLYTAVTDCGAGGLSSAVGEMAEGVGADVDVALAPLKYPGLRPWEVWLSEAQERMVFAVPPMHLSAVVDLCTRHGVEAVSLGAFTGDGVLRVRSGDLTVLELDTHFLHDGRPQRTMNAVMPAPVRDPAAAPDCADPAATCWRCSRTPTSRPRSTSSVATTTRSVARRWSARSSAKGTTVTPMAWCWPSLRTRTGWPSASGSTRGSASPIPSTWRTPSSTRPSATSSPSAPTPARWRCSTTSAGATLAARPRSVSWSLRCRAAAPQPLPTGHRSSAARTR